MMAHLLISLGLALSFSTSLLAAEAAKVIRIRGYATQLSPGAKQARVVELGQKIFEDTSILTKPKSFVVMEFSDGARMSVGPDSKVVLTKARDSGPGIISLLKGKIRSTVNPENNDNDKYMVRTRTAAMGVRGTDFQTSYNPDNKATSLVTFKGKVAMARLDTPAHELEADHQKEGQLTVERDERGEPRVERALKAPTTRVQDLQNVLKSSETVVVENGHYAGAVTGLTRPTEPVVINQVQLGLMYQNEQLAPKKEGEKLAKVDFSKIKHTGSADGFYDAKSGRFAPRAGGFVDPDTALYIPPKEDSVFDEQKNVYLPKNVGYVNKDTGDYVPPKGLILDPKNGFVAKSKDGVLVAQAGQMNITMAKDVLLKDIDEEAPIMRPNKRERINQGAVWIAFGPGNESHSVSNDSLGSALKDDGDGSFDVQFGHDQEGEKEWQALTRVGIRSVDFMDRSVNVPSSTLWSIGAGVRHAFSPRVAALGLISLKQTFIYNHPQNNSVTTNEWSRFTIPTIDLMLESEFLRTNRFAMIADGGLILTLPKSKADVDAKSSLGFKASLGAEYWTSRRMTVGLSFEVKRQSFELESSRFTSEDELASNALRLKVQYFY